ncbi:MAG TPA: DUF1801 domain-containing protein [candidate division Zixibacteria bacterium]|nr:DUF1801 domain-containing protein [candidate division Zixibacteria bacterium]
MTNASIEKFLNSVKDKKQREDSFEVLKVFKQITKEKPKMWGPSIVGFGTHHYKYASGREGDWPIAAFSPRKGNLTLYFMPGFDRSYSDIMKSLGKYKTGKCCLYIKKLEDVDRQVLSELIKSSVEWVKKGLYGTGGYDGEAGQKS